MKLNHKQVLEAISFIRPNAAFCLRADNLEWLDDKQSEPTKAEIEAGWIAYESKVETDRVDAAAKKAAAEAKLAALGLDANDLKALGLA